jgi:ABC-type glycerol-3-phosphate transport system permease component
MSSRTEDLIASRGAVELRPSAQRVRASLGYAGWYLPASLIGLLFMAPFAWAIASSLKAPPELFAYPPRILPSVPQWQNYAIIWSFVPLLTFFENSFLVGILATLGQTLSAAVVAYGFARFRFPGRNVLFLCVLATLIVPDQVTMVPRFLMFKEVGWLDTFYPLWVPAWLGGNAFFVFLLRQFFLTIPRELEDAAEIDGASSVRIFVDVVLPLAIPAIATVIIFSFLWNWNEFLQALIYLNKLEHFTVPLGLRFFMTDADQGGMPKEALLMAASLVDTLPPIVIFFALQRYFIRGIVMTGIKG